MFNPLTIDLDLAGMPLVPRFQMLGHGDPSSSNDRDLYSTPDGYRYMKGKSTNDDENSIFIVDLEFLDEQNSPQAMGVVQHQTPDTTSPSPPHPYSNNGNFSTVVHPSGNIEDRGISLWPSSSTNPSSLCEEKSLIRYGE